MISEPPPYCKGCGETITSEPIVQALNSDWHPKCFRCSTCGKRLNNWYILNRGNIYCRRDYWSKFGDLCNGCTLVISGPVMVAGEHKYHPECFQCIKCGGLIGDGDPYALVERSYLYCGQCYRVGPSQCTTQELPPPLSPVSKYPRRKPHSIQMVEIPPTPDHKQQHPHHHGHHQDRQRKQQQHQQQDEPQSERQHKLHLTLQTTPFESGTLGVGYRNSFILEGGRMPPCIQISELGSSPELTALAVGDRILEVNGSTVRDKSLEEINSLLTNNQKPVHIMLERDLSPLRLPPDEEGALPTFPLTKSLSRSSLDDSYSSAASDNETIMVQGTPVRLRPKGSLRARGHSPTRRRSKSPSPCPAARQKSVDLNRSHSFSTRQQEHRVFRAVDLLLGEILGQGFFGQAIKATHRVTGEQMVLKELHNFDEDAQKSFLREVSMLRNLSHPCVLKFMGVLYRDKKLNLVTEFIDGGTLSDLLLDHSVELSWKQRVAFAKDIAAGMKYLHSMDIIHRDLNSQNCLVRKDYGVVVADFGLAKIFPRHENFHLTSSSEKERETLGSSSKLGGKKKRLSRRKRQTVVGNPYWMAPEMMTKGVYDEKVDVFSFGIIVCETIARVTADPDYLPRSIDFGLNVEAFHKRFCKEAPEPYFMLAVLCSQIEPDQRPSFEKVHMLCEALHLHVEHNMAAPLELQGSSVEFYLKLKDKMYGYNYRDLDSSTQAVSSDAGSSSTAKDAKVPRRLSVSQGRDGEILSTVHEELERPIVSAFSSCSSCSNSSQEDDVPLQEKLAEQLNSNEVLSNASNAHSGHGNDDHSNNCDDLGTNVGNASTTTNEDHAYFSCSSPSLSPSSPCLSPEEFASCKSSSGDSISRLPSLVRQDELSSLDSHLRNNIILCHNNNATISHESLECSHCKTVPAEMDLPCINISTHSVGNHSSPKSQTGDHGSTMLLEYGAKVVPPPHLLPSAVLSQTSSLLSTPHIQISCPTSPTDKEVTFARGELSNLSLKDQSLVDTHSNSSASAPCEHVEFSSPTLTHSGVEASTSVNVGQTAMYDSDAIPANITCVGDVVVTNDISVDSKVANSKLPRQCAVTCASVDDEGEPTDLSLHNSEICLQVDQTGAPDVNSVVKVERVNGVEGGPMKLLSPEHENGMSSSRRRNRRSLKSSQREKRSTLADQP